jgi:hypothetical protein
MILEQWMIRTENSSIIHNSCMIKGNLLPNSVRGPIYLASCRPTIDQLYIRPFEVIEVDFTRSFVAESQ